MKLSIIDTEKITVHDVTWVELNTHAGNMIIQPNHVPMIIELTADQELLFELTNGEQKSLIITQAIAHVTRSEIKILIPIVV